MSDFVLMDCIIRDSGGISRDFDDNGALVGDDLSTNWQNNPSMDLLSESMHDSGILTSNAFNCNNDSIMMETENDDLLKSMLTGLDGNGLQTFGESLDPTTKVTADDPYHPKLNLDETLSAVELFDQQLLSPTSSSSSSDSPNSVSDGGESQTATAASGANDVLDLIDYIDNDNYDIEDDVTLQAVDPRTISPTGYDVENDVAKTVEVYPGNNETEIMLNEQQNAVNNLMCEIDILEGKRQQQQQQRNYYSQLCQRRRQRQQQRRQENGNGH
jgi:hypothetical protein